MCHDAAPQSLRLNVAEKNRGSRNEADSAYTARVVTIPYTLLVNIVVYIMFTAVVIPNYHPVAKMAREHEGLLSNDSLASYLRELEDSDDTLALPLALIGGVGSSSTSETFNPEPTGESLGREAHPASKPVAWSAKARHNDRVKRIRSEIDTLYRQLVRVQRESAIRSNSNVAGSRVNWKRRAEQERLTRDRAEYENGYMKDCLAECVKTRNELMRLMLKQQQLLPRKLIKIEDSLVDTDTHTFGLLKPSYCGGSTSWKRPSAAD